MLLCDREGEWTKYNMIMDQTDFKILELYNANKTVEQMCALDQDLKKATVYRRIEKMKKGGVILDGKESADDAARENY
jgi:Fe2+ or Zn2+ uptake regulation protein